MESLELENLLNLLRTKTVEINNMLEKDDEDFLGSLEKLLDERQDIIDNISSIEYSKSDFKEIYYNFKLEDEEEKLNFLLHKKRTSIKEEIDGNRKEIIKKKNQRSVNRKYSNINPIDPIFLSKKY